MGAWTDPQPAEAGPPCRRLVIVVRADPVICGHSGEARNLAEAALHRGFTEVRIVTWPLDLLESSGLPLGRWTAYCPTARASRWSAPSRWATTRFRTGGTWPA